VSKHMELFQPVFNGASASGVGGSSHGARQRSAASIPVRIHAADGRLLAIGLPCSTAPERGALAAPASRGSTVIGGGSVLMLPEKPVWEERFASRCLLGFLIALDASMLLWFLGELSWRELHRTHAVLLGFFGLVLNILGAAGCYFPWPRLLGLVGTGACLQLFLSSALLQSVPQMLHLCLQPWLAYESLELRAALLPSWFSIGRIVRADLEDAHLAATA